MDERQDVDLGAAQASRSIICSTGALVFGLLTTIVVIALFSSISTMCNKTLNFCMILTYVSTRKQHK